MWCFVVFKHVKAQKRPQEVYKIVSWCERGQDKINVKLSWGIYGVVLLVFEEVAKLGVRNYSMMAQQEWYTTHLRWSNILKFFFELWLSGTLSSLCSLDVCILNRQVPHVDCVEAQGLWSLRNVFLDFPMDCIS